MPSSEASGASPSWPRCPPRALARTSPLRPRSSRLCFWPRGTPRTRASTRTSARVSLATRSRPPPPPPHHHHHHPATPAPTPTRPVGPVRFVPRCPQGAHPRGRRAAAQPVARAGAWWRRHRVIGVSPVLVTARQLSDPRAPTPPLPTTTATTTTTTTTTTNNTTTNRHSRPPITPATPAPRLRL